MLMLLHFKCCLMLTIQVVSRLLISLSLALAIITIIFVFLYFLSQTNIITDQEPHQTFKVPLLGLREPRDIMRKPQHNQH